MKNIVISADGDRKVYSVPDAVADNLTRYCGDLPSNSYLSFCFIASFAFVLQMLRAKPIPLILLCIIRHNTNG